MRSFLLLMPLLLSDGRAAAGDRPKSIAEKTPEQWTAETERILAETRIKCEFHQESIPLSQFLKALEKQLPKGKELSFHIDEAAFGKGAAEVAKTPIKSLVPVEMKNVQFTLNTVLRLALSQVQYSSEWVEEVECRIERRRVVITTPERAAFSKTYDIRDLIREGRFLFKAVKQGDGSVLGQHVPLHDLQPSDTAGLLVRLILADVDPFSLQVLNGTKLQVHATRTAHATVGSLLDALRRLLDAQVLMNARLYEVERAFFAKHIVPLFAKNGHPEERPAVVAIEGDLLRRVTKQKLLGESDPVKIRPGEDTVFLAQQRAFHYQAGTPGTGRIQTGTGLAGVSFEVRATLSRDRRFLRLRITQNVVELVSISKTKKLDVLTGKEMVVESPNVRKASLAGTVQIADAAAILMPVDYRPAGKEDKVWLMVARPLIWIDGEAEAIAEGGKAVTPESASKAVWETEPPKPDPPPPAVPLTDERRRSCRRSLAMY